MTELCLGLLLFPVSIIYLFYPINIINVKLCEHDVCYSFTQKLHNCIEVDCIDIESWYGVSCRSKMNT